MAEADSCQATLKTSVQEAREAKVLQLAHRIAAQQATQRVAAALAKGREAASRLRSFLKAALGPHNEELVRFGVAPIRKRRARRAAPSTDAGR
jgi:hypothetical protein